MAGQNDSIPLDKVDWSQFGEPIKPASTLRRAGDMGLKLAQGVVGVPEAMVGLADMATGGRAGKMAEDAGVRFKDAKGIIGGNLSPEQKAADAAVQQAQGFIPTAVEMVKNPSTILGAVVESSPSMVAGGLASRGLLALAPRIGGVAAGAIGEGATSAGQNAEQVRQEDPNGLLSAKQSALLAGSGVLTGGIGFGAGKLANKLGIGDVNTMLATGRLGTVGAEAAQTAATKGALRKIGEGALTEGVLQELPQSYQEQVAQNLAQGKPWDEGAGAAAAQGMLAGGLMGAGGAGLSSFGERRAAAAQPAPGQDQTQPQVQTPATEPGAQAQPLLLGNQPDAMISFPDGTVARKSEVNQYIASLPPEAQMQARAKLFDLNQQNNQSAVYAPASEVVDPAPVPLLGMNTAPTGRFIVDENGDTRPETGVDASRTAQILREQQQEQERLRDIGLTSDVQQAQARNMARQQFGQTQVRPSIAMGINPNAGPLSSAAAVAVDGGAHVQTTGPSATGFGLRGFGGEFTPVTPVDQRQGIGMTARIGGPDYIDVAARELSDQNLLGAGRNEPRGRTARAPSGGTGGGGTGARKPVVGLLPNQSAQGSRFDPQTPQLPGSLQSTPQVPVQTQGQAAPAQTPAKVASPPGQVVSTAAPVAPPSTTATKPRPATWRTNIRAAASVARGMGVEVKGRKLGDIVADIDRADSSATASQDTDRYQLPEGGIHKDWMHSKAADFQPTARQKMVMDATAQALDEGLNYETDISNRVAELIGIPPELRSRNNSGTEGGDVGYDIYYARGAVEAQRGNQRSRDIAKEMNIKPGDMLGTIINSDYKQSTNVKIVSISDSGLVAKIEGKRGAAILTGEMGVDAIKASINRAKEKGKRKDGYAEFVAARAAQQAPAAAESAAPAEAPAQASGPTLRKGDWVSFPIDADGNRRVGEITSISGKKLSVVMTGDIRTTVSRDNAQYVSKVTNPTAFNAPTTAPVAKVMQAAQDAGKLQFVSVGDKAAPAAKSEPTSVLSRDYGNRLPPEKAAKLQEAHKAIGRDVTRQQVQKMRDRLADEIESGTTNNGGVIGKLNPLSIKKRKEQLDRLDQDLSLFGRPESDGQNDELDAEMRSYEAKAGAGSEKKSTLGTLNSSQNLIEPENKGGKNEPAKLDQPSPQKLARAQPQDVPGVVPEPSPDASTGGRSRTNASGNDGAGTSRVQQPRGVGNDAGEVPAPATRVAAGGGTQHSDKPVQAGERPAKSDSSERLAGNQPELTPQTGTRAQDRADGFVITEADAIGEGGTKTKFKQNITAIKLLKTLTAENRQATRAEQATLAKYVGWGGIPQAFERDGGAVSKGWEKEVAELKASLTAEELAAAAASTRNAHYTSPEIVSGLWAAVKHFGFSGGRTLEPSVGVGNFFGLMPADLRSASQLTGVELDHITGGIAKQLYPQANIATPVGFQDFSTPDGYFDLAIGNPPFGAEGIYDANRKQISGFSIHNYFFAKSLDSVRPNGVLAMVVTNRLLDSARDKARSYLAERAEFIGAVRLPNDAFAKNAGTQVTTDIIFLRKLKDGEKQMGQSWQDVKSYRDKAGIEVPLNEYFLKNPQMMLGDFGAYGSMYSPNDPALVARPGQDTSALLAAAIARLPKGFMDGPTAAPVTENIKPLRDVSSVKVGSMFTQGGKIFERREDMLGTQQAKEVAFASDKAHERVEGMLGVRDALIEVRRLQLQDDATDASLSAARAALNKGYDSFVKANGPLNADANKRLMRDDPTWPQIAALEDGFDKGITPAVARTTGEKPRPPSARKAAIFSKRTQSPYRAPASAKSAKDALVSSLSERGRVDLDYMASLYGKPHEAITQELAGLVFKNPVGSWESHDQYLSGNVKKKLAQAIEASKSDPGQRANVDALRAVQPIDIEAIDIDVKMGAHWIPADEMEGFVSHLTQGTKAKAVYNPVSAAWTLSAQQIPQSVNIQYGTDRANVLNVLEAAANQKQITIRDKNYDGTTTLNVSATTAANEKVELVKAEWKSWLWADDTRRERLSKIYNDVFNTDVQRDFDGSHLTFPGKVGNDVIQLRPHQANAVWRMVQSGTTLLDHVVGAGKTFTMIAGIMEMRRMGLAKKPMLVVPNHLVGQWAEDFMKLYPGANILAATKKDFEKDNRKKLFARIATGDWDAVIVAHSSLGKVEVDPKFQATFIKQQIADMDSSISAMREAEGKNSRNVKQIEKQKAMLDEKLQKLFDTGSKDDNLYFSELGVDALLLDEAHEFKNLGFSTGMQRVAGLGNPSGSNKAADMFMKVQSVLERTGGRNVVFATGTPISNTMAEMYTMQRFLDYGTLKDQGIAHFDAWAKTFGEVVTDWELSPSGQYKMNSRFAKFVNMPELMQRYQSFGDVINRDDINRMLAKQGKRLPIPAIKGGKPENVIVERSATQANYIGIPFVDENGVESYRGDSLIYRSEHLPKGPAAKGSDNMLRIMSDARKAALDMRLIDPSYADNPGSKVNVAARSIKDIYDQWSAKKGVQLVFCDLSTPKAAVAKEAAELRALVALAEQGDEAAQEKLDAMSPDTLLALDSKFSVYDDLKAKLLASGIPASEVAFIHDASTELQKEDLFAKVRSGRIRVLMGSTAKMGAGMNVQDRLVALHHMDAPWRPSDLEQREGRIIRQGNLFEPLTGSPEAVPGFQIQIMRYATKQTLDSRMWQTIEAKARFIEQVRKGTGERQVEDVASEAANSAEMKAASSGNPLILEEMTLRQKVRKLEGQSSEHDRAQHRIKDNIRRMKDQAESYTKQANDMRGDAELVPKTFEVVIGSSAFTKHAEAGEAILREIDAMHDAGQDSREIGRYGGFALHVDDSSIDLEKKAVLTAIGGAEHQIEANPGSSPMGLALRLQNTIKGISSEVQRLDDLAAKNRNDIPAMQKQIGQWDGAQELADAKKRHATVLDQLKPKKQVVPTPPEPTAFSRGNLDAVPGITKPPTRAEIEATVRAMTSGWKNAPRVVVLDSMQDPRAPESARQDDARQRSLGAEGSVEGFVQGGTVYLVTDALSSQQRVAETLAHEVLGHYGLRGMFGDNLVPVFGQIATMRRADMAAKALEYGLSSVTNPDATDAQILDGMTRAQKLTAADEILAEMAQTQPQIGLVRRAVAAIRTWLRQHIPAMRSLKLTDDEIVRSFVLPARGWVERGRGGSLGVGGTLFSRSRAANPQPNTATNQVVTSVKDFIRNTGRRLQDFRGMALQGLGLSQLTEVYGDMLPPMTKYQELVQKMSAERNEIAAGADELATRWGNLDKTTKRPGENERLANLMHDATLGQIDPAKDFVDGDDRTKYNALRARWNALSPQAKEVYTKARNDYAKHYKDVRKAITERIERSALLAPAKAALLNRMDAEFFGRIKGVYFPLARFGDYLVVARDQNGDVASMSKAETLPEADALRESLLRDFPAARGYSVSKVLKSREFNATRDLAGRGFMKELFSELDKAGVSPEVMDGINQLYLTSLPDLSWAKHGIHRKGTAGFSQDARRAYAQNMLQGGRYLAKVRHSDQLQTELDAMQQHVDDWKDTDGFDPVKAQQVVDEMVKRHDTMMNPQTSKFSQALTSTGFLYHLGASPASAMVNLLQTGMVSYPVMGAKWGFDKAAAALGNASKLAIKSNNDIRTMLKDNDLAAVERAVKEGVIDVTLAHDLSGIAAGEDTGAMWKLRPVMRYAGWMFHHAERFNRQITFLAAYRLAKEKGKERGISEDEAYREAKDVVYGTHFDYSAANAPRIMQGNVARVVTQFKKFGQNMLYLMGKLIWQSLDKMPSEQRTEARRALGGLLATHAAAAGVLGLPAGLVAVPLAIASFLGGSDDEPWDAETAMKNYLAETLGQKPAEVLAHGLSRLTPFDISGRVGLNSLVLPDVQDGLSGGSWFDSHATALLGPSVGAMRNVWKGGTTMSEGKWQRGLEEMMPATLRGPMKSIRFATEGNVDKTGIVINEQLGIDGVLGQFFGLAPQEAALAAEGRRAIYREDKALSQRRSSLMRMYAMAVMAGDAEGAQELRDAVVKFNTANPTRSIKPAQLAQSVRARQRRINEADGGVYLPNGHQDAREAGVFAQAD